MGTTTTSATFGKQAVGGLRSDSQAIESTAMQVVCVSIIVPTYCEAKNLPDLCARIFRTTRAAGIDAELLIVDDASPDRTADVVADLSKNYSIRLITRNDERGLSSAVVRGFQESDRDILVCMDADLSHPPENLVDVIMPVARDESDFSIGSRYIDGGRTDENWGFLRRLNSKVATWLARPLVNAMDPMAGYFCLHRRTFESAQKNGLLPIGYKIGLEICVRAGCSRISEVPIHFVDRCEGESKLTTRQQLLYLRQLLHLFVARRPYFLASLIFLSGFVFVIAMCFIVIAIKP